jgi:uncharacterized RDD family membrane protein YckC
MIRPTMAVAAAGSTRSDIAEYARDAHLMRFMALIVDTFALGLITFVVNNVYGVTQPTTGSLTVGGGTYSTVVAWPWLTLVGILYFAIPEAMFGATPGKLWARLRVVSLDDRPLRFGAVLVRNLFRPIDFLPVLYMLGGLLVRFTRGSQRVGDMVAGTTVVYRHRALQPGATRSSSVTARRILLGSLLFAVLFTIAFDYFGRPPFVLQGLENTHAISPPGPTQLTFGSPVWSWGQVTYPIMGVSGNGACRGSMTLDWEWLAGWQLGGGGWSCNPQ